MTHKELDNRDYGAILRARTNADSTPRPGYKRNVEAIKETLSPENVTLWSFDGKGGAESVRVS